MKKPLLIQQLEKELDLEKEFDATFNKVPLEEIKKWRSGRSLKYSINTSGDITGLRILGFGLREFPSILKELKYLKVIDLKGNQFTDISVLINLPNLTNLDLGFNQLTDISGLSNFPNLTNLDLRDNQLTDISGLSNFPNLTNLDLGYNQLTDISVLSNFPNLTNLDLRGNQLTDIFVLSNLPNLTNLNLDFNQLTDISVLSNLPNLTNLNLDFNKLTDISVLSNLRNLTNLRLCLNKIIDISVLSNLPNLTNLDLKGNELTDISALKKLTNLSFLDLRGNPIKKLPKWICDFPNMDIQWGKFGSVGHIVLYDNPLQDPPAVVVKQGKEAVRAYFEQKERKGTDYLYEAKLILVGEERAGKSTIAKALIEGDAFQINHEEESTQGIDILKWLIPKNKTNSPKDFRFNIWDFGGQEIYHTTHQFFLTQRSLYVFLTEARKDLRFDDFYYWLNIINTLGGDSPILAVKNKIDQSSASNDISGYKKMFPQMLNDNFIGVSCNTDDKKWKTEYLPLLNVFKENIYNVVKNNQIEGLGMPLPASWVKVREEITVLQDKGLDYITFKDYKKICEKYNLDEDTIDTLSGIFHDLGVFLHFRKNIKLRNTVFINHEYVTQGVYKIFDNDEIIKSKGQFTEKDLIAILKGSKYENKQAELISLCEAFKILFKKNRVYLAPQLFEERKPEIEWNFAQNLHYKYSYAFMPRGIVSYLIVEMHEYINQNHYWRYGAEFSHKNTFALVEEKRLNAENEIRITLRGDNQNEFLTIIRNQLDKINSRFTNLEPKERVGCICEECKNSNAPYFFEATYIKKVLENKKRTVECQKSTLDVEVSDLLKLYKRENEREKHFVYITREEDREENRKPIKDVTKEKNRQEYIDKEVRKWRWEFWIVLLVGLIFFVVFPGVFLLYKVNWDWNTAVVLYEKFKLEQNTVVWIVKGVISFISVIVGKLFYDRYFNQSNIKAFKEGLKIPEELK